MPKHIIKVHRSLNGQRRITLPADLLKSQAWGDARYAILAGEKSRITIAPLSDKILEDGREEEESEDGHEQ